MTTPTLETERLWLRAFREEPAQAEVMGIASEPAFSKAA